MDNSNAPDWLSVEEILEQWRNAISKHFDHTHPSAVGCSHEYVEYTGLLESFSYCKHCDEKVYPSFDPRSRNPGAHLKD